MTTGCCQTTRTFSISKPHTSYLPASTAQGQAPGDARQDKRMGLTSLRSGVAQRPVGARCMRPRLPVFRCRYSAVDIVCLPWHFYGPRTIHKAAGTAHGNEQRRRHENMFGIKGCVCRPDAVDSKGRSVWECLCDQAGPRQVQRKRTKRTTTGQNQK